MTAYLQCYHGHDGYRGHVNYHDHGSLSIPLPQEGQPERATQNRVIALFRDELGYGYLSDWTDGDDNSNIERGLFSVDVVTRTGIYMDLFVFIRSSTYKYV